jgi:hypothetical protein
MVYKPSYPAWSQSIFVQPPTCMGVQLKPFSWAHYECLKRFYSPYLLSGVKTGRPDLLRAVWICQRTWEELQRDLFHLRDVRSMLRENWRTRRQDFVHGDAQFRQYVTDYQFVPATWNEETGEMKKTMGTPLSQIMAGFLMEFRHFTESQAWNCPIARSICYRLQWLEDRGLVEINSERSEIGHAMDIELGLVPDDVEEMAVANG